MRTWLCASVVLIASAAPVAAQQSVDGRIDAAHATSIDWSGLYIGGSAAYIGASGIVPAQGGVAGSLFTGYNFDFGTAVAGLEAGVALADIEVLPAQRLNTVIDLRGRLGVAFDNVHIYGTGGGAWTGAGGPGTASGYAAGAGIDWAAGENTSWGLQYIRYTFRNFRNTGNTLDIDLVSGRISYRF